MLLFFLAYLGGVLTIFSPCVLPVLPFIFARSDQSFRRSSLPILLGMAATFTLLASFAAVGGAWLIALNRYGRYAAMLLLLLMGLALIFPALSERLMRPFVAFGGRLQQRADQQASLKGSLLLGVAVGFLWAPCAGPILGLVLAGAALNGANLYSALLLLVFAAGAATSLAVALLAGERVFSLMKRGLGAEEWLRRGLGVAVLGGVVVIALGWDTRFLSQFTFLSTANTEQQLISQLAKPPGTSSSADSRMAPPLTGATQWLNSPPLTDEMIQALLKEAHQGRLAIGDALVQVAGSGATAAAAADDARRSPETYLGYARLQNLASPEAIKKDTPAHYSAPRALKLNQWALSGKWRVSAEAAAVQASGGTISYRFQGRDLHLVLGSRNGKPVRFKVTLDSAAPGADHGADIDAQGNGVIREQRLYQLIRQSGKIAVHTFRIEFLDTDAEAFAFTFG